MRLQWLPRDRFSLRRAAPIDRAGWLELAGASDSTDWPLAGPASDRDRRWVVESDGLMVGGLALAPISIDATEPLHPWEALEADPPQPRSTPEVPGRLVTRLFLAEGASLEAARIVDAPLKGVIQQDGRRRLVVRVPLDWLPEAGHADSPDAQTTRGVRWEPSSWLQQFTYRAFDLRALTTWTDAGFRLEGYYPGDPPLARLVWDNSRG